MGNKYDRNRALKKYFEFYISKMEVDDEFKPILVDIMMRRADAFKLSSEEIGQDMSSLVNNLREIKVGDMPPGYEKCWGLCEFYPPRITISGNYAQTSNGIAIYHTLTHEVYHALARDENGNDRMAMYNMYTGEYNSSLLEAIVEKASYRAVFGNNRQENAYFNRSAIGYSNITFIADAIEATYGVSEEEFLKNGIMGRERLAEFLASRSGESQDKSYEFLDMLEVNYSRLHATYYPEPGQQMTYEEQKDSIKDAMTGIYTLCEEKMAERLWNKPINSADEAIRFGEEINYDHNKLIYTLNDALGRFSNDFGDHWITQEVLGRTQQARENTLYRISDMNAVLAAGQKLWNDGNFLGAFNTAKRGRLFLVNPNILRRDGINRDLKYTFDVSRNYIDRHFEGDDLRGKYDNSKVADKTQKVCMEKLGIKKPSLFDRIKSIISPKKRLSPPQSQAFNSTNETVPQTISSIFGEITPEQQTEYNRGVQKAVETYESNLGNNGKENGKDDKEL